MFGKKEDNEKPKPREHIQQPPNQVKIRYHMPNTKSDLSNADFYAIQGCRFNGQDGWHSTPEGFLTESSLEALMAKMPRVAFGRHVYDLMPREDVRGTIRGTDQAVLDRLYRLNPTLKARV